MFKRIGGVCMGLLVAHATAQDFSGHAAPTSGFHTDYVLGNAREYWAGGQVNWYYNPLNQPSNLTQDQVIAAIKTAGARWSAMCNVSFNYMGTTTANPSIESSTPSADRVNVYGWGPLTGSRSIYGGYAQWYYANGQMIDADILINSTRQWTQETFEAIMTHEMGHALGLNHSDQTESVMFANPYHSYSYQRTLRGDDANACAALYGAASTAESSRTMNWAEQAYAPYLSGGPAAPGEYDGYYYRYYPGTRSYVGTKNGAAYFMGPDGVIQNMGALSGYTPQVRAAGF
jgi:hypothetical protein